MSPIVVFDLDGTLVDTAPDLIASLNSALKLADIAPVDTAAFRPLAGRGGRVMLEVAFARAGRRLDDETLARLQAAFVSHYADSMPGTSQLFPGGVEALARLADEGYRLAICTNKPETLARRLFDRMGMAHRFAFVAGADTFAWKKPDPRHLISTVEHAGGDRDRAVMVGDTITDVDTAKAAGIPVVAVDFGYSDVPVRNLEPSAVIGHFDELTRDLINRLTA